ncbi:MAG: hypothetical protein Q7V06_01510, partial [Methanocalculus sp.]|nr:hypothetical protein [Methanocalculus sp.]
MKDDAVVTFDFLVGFTIFIISFIFVAAMVPHALFAVQSSRIDYDAVAYRTGVILTEDPGMPASPDFPVWEYQMVSSDVVRMGLAVEKGAPHILSLGKVERFFDTNFFTYPDDYRRSLIFGDYPYSFNITLTARGIIRSIGPDPPASYGTVRRVVAVKEPSVLIVDGNEDDEVHKMFHVSGNTTPNQRFAVEIPCALLLNRSVEPAFRIDPRTDPLQIDIRNFDKYLNATDPATLTEIRISRDGITLPFTAYTLIVDESIATLPVEVSESVFFILHPVPHPPWREQDTLGITFV